MGLRSAGHEPVEFKQVVSERDVKNKNVDIRWSQPTSTRRPSRCAGQRAGCGEFAPVQQRRYLLPSRRVDLPQPVSQARQDQREHLPGRIALLHPVQGHPRCALPLLADTFGLYYNKAPSRSRPDAATQGPSRSCRHMRRATVKKSTGHRRRRLQPERAFYHGGAGISTYGTLIGATYFDKNGKSGFLSRDAWSRLPQVAEIADRLLRLRQARSLADGRR